MAASRKDTNSGWAFTVTLFWVAVLMLFYWLAAEWPELPKLFASVKASLHWPV